MHARLTRPAPLALALLLAIAAGGRAASMQTPPPTGCAVTGTVTAGGTPLPGVVVGVTDADGRPLDASSSSTDGSYRLRLPGAGPYKITGELVAFVPILRDLVVDEANCRPRLDLVLTLQSRAQSAARQALPSTPATRGMQPLSLRADAAGLNLNRLDETPERDADAASQLLLPPGFSPDASTESVTTIGSAQAAESSFGPGGAGDRFANGFGDGQPGEQFGGQFGGPGGGRGGGPGFGGPAAGGFGGRGAPGFGRGRTNQIRGAVFQSFDTSALDAAPFALNGHATAKPDYFQERLGATLGGPLTIPRLLGTESRTMFFLNYTGNHSRNPYDAYSTVPSLAERAGDLSALGLSIIDPATHQPFADGRIPVSSLDPTAQALLALIPVPNQPGERQNFHTVETTTSQVDDVNVRIVHLFGAARPQQRGQGNRGFGRGGPAGGSNLNVGIHFRHSDSGIQNPFPALGGTTRLTAWDVPVGFSFTKGGMLQSLRFQFNRQRSDTQNLYAFDQNVAGQAGLLGVSTDPFDWGAPNLSFSTFNVRDVNPATRIDRTIAIGDAIVKTHRTQTFRFGGDYRDVRFDSRTDANARGSFVFSGLFSGVDFGDFLLGLPQQSSAQYRLGPGPDQFRAGTWDAFVQDDWRASSTVTINAGLRYEYYSPYAESQNQLVNLDVAPGFGAVVPVVAGNTGPYSGALPDTLVRPDRTAFAPRVGIAWKAQPATVVRAGYGVNYNASVYQRIAQQLAGQPPFAVTNTVLASALTPVALASALTTAPTSVTTNTYAVDPDYRLGSVQIWNVDVQHDIARTVSIGVGYTGTKGANLDVVRAPNRGPDDLLIADIQPFLFESSGGDSIMHALSVRIRKRLTHGFAAGGTYTLSKSIDDASSIGGVGDVVVAQNDRDLAAERGLSSFDQRHRFSGDFTLALPFGTDRRWLTSGARAAVFGNWQVNGNVQIASGTPVTARVLGAIGDVAGGVNGTLRADDNGQPISVSDPTAGLFFNTSAFSVPAAGTFGNAGRNTIVGPGTTNLNLGLTKIFAFGTTRVLSIQVLASNVLNDVQFATIDTVVNSPTFGQVTSVRAMRRVQILTRVRF
jgi:hypothetical protein